MMFFLQIIFLLFLNAIQQPAMKQTLPVVEAFDSIEPTGEVLGFWVGHQFDSLANKLSFNHFQGIQRLKNSNYLLLTANGDTGALLHVVELASRQSSGAFGTNIQADGVPPAEDRIVANIVLSEAYNHAGGIQAVDNILAISLEDGHYSKIIFFDVEKPQNPQKLATEISRKNKGAGAVSFFKQKAGSEVFVVLVKGADVDLYVSSSTDLNAATFELIASWQAIELQAEIEGDVHFGNYQNINALRLANGQMYLFGLHNNTRSWLRVFSRDYADLFRFEMGNGKPVFTKIAKKRFECQEGFLKKRDCNFDAGAGVYVDAQNRLFIYAVAHEPADGFVTFVEYTAAAMQ